MLVSRRLRLLLLPSLLLGACPADSGPAATSSPPPAKPANKAPTPDAKTPPPETTPTPKPEPPAVATPDPTPAPPVAVTPEIEAEVASNLNTFGLDLYRRVAATPGDQIISPASVSIALAMTHVGARGQTAKEIETALHFGRPIAEVQAAVAQLLARLGEPKEGVELAVANRLFGEATVPFEKPLLDTLASVFGAPLETVDFIGAAPKARDRINDWVEHKTHDRIKKLLPEGSVVPSTRLVLVNALYFKAPWADPFEEEQTKPAPFFAAAGARDVPTMHSVGYRAFADLPADGVQVVELSYDTPSTGMGTGLAMTVLVPTAKDGLADMEAKLTASTLAGWIEATKGERIELWMPKFRIAPEQSLRLGEILGELGIRTAFSGDADFTGMAPAEHDIELSECFHRGFIEVDEKGTEAAAATAIVGRAGSAAPAEPRSLRVDRPFLYLIRDTRSGLVLFIGRVLDPKTA